ncbi:hypothetical protein L226DRAFT_554330 [Lentinus tigrinus ALCF2SS1-7]|uniref:Uncharacterized protein n=1 Tax=Lentinus tigrinus ALCF2SS1-6 TaxID=1328759 RepID=A0A5C2S0T5_9APHY|nr:hypothetical protein L227DRAFT_242254 [Lentinus tigrinus ALCF2SS1-6]RPD71759.1 hypothetical protein L226DRAFT_554330 [Lentinus tigrinus ALCF2SS1-7]
MENRRNADAGPSRERLALKSGVRKVAQPTEPLRPGYARKSTVSNPRDRNNSLADDNDRRIAVRKTAKSTPPLAQPQPQASRSRSNFSYVAPLLRTRTLPTKEGALLPSAHIAADRREREKRRERDEYVLGPIRSAPRTSLPSMSVQRRVAPSPRKQQQSPVSRRAPAINFTPHIPKPRVHVGRGGKLVFGSSDSEDEPSSPPKTTRAEIAERQRPSIESGGRMPRIQLAAKAARKTKPMAAIEPEESVTRLTSATKNLSVGVDSDDDMEDRPRRLRPGDRLPRIRKTQATSVSASESEREDNVIVLSDSDDDVKELLRALDALTLAEARLQKHKRLPFLLYNLEKGFADRCRRHGIRVEPPNAPRGAVKVVFKYYLEAKNSGASSDSGSDAREYQTYVGSMVDWRCPMCELHKPFNTREMLNFHLARDHSEVKVSWKEIMVRSEHRWRLDLVIPDINEREESSSEEDEEPADVQQQEDGHETLDQTEERQQEAGPPSREPLFLLSTSPPPVTPSTTLFSTEEVEEKNVLRLSTSPIKPKWRQSSTPGFIGKRPSLPTVTRTSYRGSLPARYPSPPPPHDKLGPAAQYPYIPEKDESGQELYSCRIGGPRLFDLVSMLPTEQFGVMAWAIVDREEELFEMEDLRDEEKVMLALWNRYIMINRASFIANEYFVGVKAFITQYWKIIHQAAGWRALRAFLMNLSVNNFLTFDKVLKSLQHYEELIGMSLWYKDDVDAAGGAS